MSLHTTKHSNGEILTGKLWRKSHPFFHELPFYSDIPRMDEMAVPLEHSLGDVQEGCYKALLIKLGKGLDEVYPFSDTIGVDIVLREATRMLSPHLEAVGPKNAARIWGFMSKFVMLDRFSATFGASKIYPGVSIPKKFCPKDYFGSAAKVLDELNPPTKVLGKFLRVWRDREKAADEYLKNGPIPTSGSMQDPAGVALALSRRLIAGVKMKNVVNIEAGLEMVALAVSISSENNGLFPEMASDVKNVLKRIWSERMEPLQLEEISDEIQSLHKSMKNVIEVVFATSPLLALSTHGWRQKSFHSTYLLRIFLSLGNGRPEILVRLEDFVLQAIIAFSEGKHRVVVMDSLYSQVSSLEKELATDEDALTWFNLSMGASHNLSSPVSSGFPSTPFAVPNPPRNSFLGGLASPPDSESSSPNFPLAQPSAAENRRLSPCRFVNPRDLQDSPVFPGGLINSPKGRTPSLGPPKGLESDSIARSRKSSSASSASGMSEDSDEFTDLLRDNRGGEPAIDGKSRGPSPRSMKSGEEVPPATGVDSTQQLPDSSDEEEEDTPAVGKSKGKEPSRNPLEEQLMAVDSEDPLAGSSDGEGEQTIIDTEEELAIVNDSKEPFADALSDDEEMQTVVDSSNEPLPDSADGEEVGQTALVESPEPLEGSLDHEKSPPSSVEDGDGDEEMVDGTLSKQSPDAMEDDEAGEASGISENQREGRQSVQPAPPMEPRRSSRLAPLKKNPLVKSFAIKKALAGKKKPAVKKHAIFPLTESDDEERPKLSDIGKATQHPTLYADIAGWGSTLEAGSIPYRHVPVQIVPPGNVLSTGEDVETLKKLEARVRADFKDGLPPHLQPNAKSTEFKRGSGQSRIFVASHSEFSRLDARDIQRILRERLILVHGNIFDYNYGWDLKSFARLYDVDKTTNALVSTKFDPHKPELRHHQGTLRDVHKISTALPVEDCPPINAISLPASRRNPYVPCQFGSLASHEVAQSRLPSDYENVFDVPDLRSHMEWSLVGTQGTVSPLHVDSDGLCTVVVVLEGSKYWIVGTPLGERHIICSVDSLGPKWDPYRINNGDDAERFSFEAIHLQKGDMLIMPGGVPHWVLGTKNAVCIGRHFYSASAIRSSIVTIVHTFLLRGAVTNEDHEETRTLLYQLIVFWSMRIDQTDVDGAHIPDISSEEGFFDILYLGIFVTLSPAFDFRFYPFPTTPPALLSEMVHAVDNFHSLLHIFCARFIILLDGQPVAYSYIVDRLLAEFAAASVLFAKGLDGHRDGGCGDEDEDGFGFSSQVVEMVEDILLESHPDVFPYYKRCLVRGHKDFLWTGPKVEIIPRSDGVVSIIPYTTEGEVLDCPAHSIYVVDVDIDRPAPSIAPSLATSTEQVGQRRGRSDGENFEDDHRKKRRR